MTRARGDGDGGDLQSAAALSRFYRAHLPTVYGYLARLSGERALAEDLTQDTFVALASALRRGDTAAADVRWLLAVARRRFIDHLRREERGQHKLRLVAASEGDGMVTTEPTRADVLAGLDGLEPLHRVVLMMRYVDELTVPEIAEAIGRTTTATYSLLARARDEMRHRRKELA